MSRSVFNPPAPLWGEGVLDNVKTLVLKISRQGCAGVRDSAAALSFLASSSGAKCQDSDKNFNTMFGHFFHDI